MPGVAVGAGGVIDWMGVGVGRLRWSQCLGRLRSVWNQCLDLVRGSISGYRDGGQCPDC